MKVSRISFPTDSPDQPESEGRVYLDMIDGVLNLVTVDGITPIGPTKVVASTAEDYEITPSNVGIYLRKTYGTANTVTVTEDDYIVGTFFEIKNVGAGTCTLTAGGADVTFVGTAALTVGKAAKVTCVSSADGVSVWEILAYA